MKNIGNLVKKIQDVMRNDAGISGDAQRIEQMTWIFFLKVYDAKEKIWALYDDKYKSIFLDELKWRNWAIDDKDGKALTGDELLNMVNNNLFPYLKGHEITLNDKKYKMSISSRTPLRHRIVKYVFEDAQNFMKNGVLLRQVINIINEYVDFENDDEKIEFGNIYETILKGLQSAGNAGEFYTPRAVTDFMVEMISPILGESIADFACGTGGFLTSSLNHLNPQIKTDADIKLYSQSIFGIEKKPMPYLLCITNMLLHDVDEPKIYHDNALEKNIRDYTDSDRFDVILMNPPYGGAEQNSIKQNFPFDLRSSETADLFMSLIMYRLKKNGRCAVIIPDGFLFGTDNAKIAIKSKLLNEFNLHTIIRLPHSVFAPYTSITTNILFFDYTSPTSSTWIYRMDMPQGYKNFSKTKPMSLEHFDPVIDWWRDKKEIVIDGSPKAKQYSKQDIESLNYNMDLCGYPHEEEEILEPQELIQDYKVKRASLDDGMDRVLDDILRLLGER